MTPDVVLHETIGNIPFAMDENISQGVINIDTRKEILLSL